MLFNVPIGFSPTIAIDLIFTACIINPRELSLQKLRKYHKQVVGGGDDVSLHPSDTEVEESAEVSAVGSDPDEVVPNEDDYLCMILVQKMWGLRPRQGYQVALLLLL